MALSKKDLKQAATEKTDPGPAAKTAKSDAVDLSPSAFALGKVKDLDPEEAGETYQREKAKRRWG